jgi:hypothetical protein
MIELGHRRISQFQPNSGKLHHTFLSKIEDYIRLEVK